MSVKKMLTVALAPYLPVFGVIFGVTLFGVSAYFDNVAMFFFSIVIISILPPILESIGNSLKDKYEATQNEMDIIAMISEIPEWSLGLEMLSSIVIMVVSAVLKNIVVLYLGLWLLNLGGSLGIVKEINGLKEDLQSPDLERRHAAMEKVKLYEQIVVVAAFSLLAIGVIILLNLVLGLAIFTLAEAAIMIVLPLTSFIPVYIVYEQADKIMPPEPEKPKDPEKIMNAAS